MSNPFDSALTAAGRFFTIGKIVLTFAVAGATALSVSFFVADYVATKTVSGLTTAVTNLQDSINNLNADFRSLSDALREETRLLRDGRESLAELVAQKVGALELQDSNQAFEVKEIRASLERIEAALAKPP